MSDKVDLLKCVYDHFNARDMETVLAALHEDVVWANGMEGGHVHGRDEVRGYWTRQWTMIDPHVEPIAFAQGPEGEVVVEIRQIVRSDRIGARLSLRLRVVLENRRTILRLLKDGVFRWMRPRNSASYDPVEFATPNAGSHSAQCSDMQVPVTYPSVEPTRMSER